jgi:ribonuclease PH
MSNARQRPDKRRFDQIRPLKFQRRYTRQAPGSVLVRSGRTTVLCTCSIEPRLPDFLVGTGKGWLTAEYGMLPGSTTGRKPREKGGKIDGRTVEIQRLIGRSLRAIVDLTRLGERTVWLDCDVLEADGGTRTAAINGAFVALVDALTTIRAEIGPLHEVLSSNVAAISVGLVDGQPRVDLCYEEDRDAEVDMNLVLTGDGRFVEIQGTGEEATFSRQQLDQLLKLGEAAVQQISALQKKALGSRWPFGK